LAAFRGRVTPGLEQQFDGELAGPRTAYLIERIQQAEVLIEGFRDLSKAGETYKMVKSIRGEHRMVEQVEVLHAKDKARTFSEMKLASQRKVCLVDGKSTKVVVAFP
jgi:hypothetical protein